MGMLAKRRQIWAMLAAPLLVVPMIWGIVLPEPPTDTAQAVIAWPDRAGQLPKLPRMIDAWLNLNFGLRAELVHANSVLRFLLKSPTSTNVTYGTKGTLYLTTEAIFEQSMGQRMRVAQVDRLADIALQIQREIAPYGGRIVVAAPPNSQTINKDTLPRWARVGNIRTEYDLLRDAVRERGVPFADLRSMLLAEKEKNEVYLRTDTHWNEHAMLLGYNQLMSTVGLDAWKVDLAKIERGFYRTKQGGDLARMLGVQKETSDLQMQVSLDAYKPRPTVITQLARLGALPRYMEVHKGGPADGPTVLVIGDSFTYHMDKLFMLHAERLLWMHHDQCGFDWKFIEELKPDLVVLAPTERSAFCVPGRSPLNRPPFPEN